MTKKKRKCCIERCEDRHTNDSENSENSENHRQLFKIPDDEETKNKWLESIGHNLKSRRSNQKNLFICIKHFTNSCFYDQELKNWKNGREITLPRKIFRLKNDSVPTIFKGDLMNSRGALTLSNNAVPNLNLAPESSKEESGLSQIASSVSNKRYEKIDSSPTSRRRIKNLHHTMSLKYLNNDEKLDAPAPVEPYSLSKLIEDWNTRDTAQFPNYWGISNTNEGVFFAFIGDIECLVTRSIFVRPDMTVELRAHNIVSKFHVLEKVSCLEELRMAMIKIVCLNICEKAVRGQCKNGFFLRKPCSVSNKCKDCQVKEKFDNRQKLRLAKRLVQKSKKQKNQMKKIRQRLSRATKKIKYMQQDIENLMLRCSSVSEESLNNAIKDLPEQQQEVVKTIIKYGKLDNKKGMRYTRRWMLECILLRIKSRKAYVHLRDHKILPLPTLTTVKNYLKNMKASYGFDQQVFNMLKKKSESMKAEQRRGVLVLDEMQISKAVSFDSVNLSVLGFTDLGDYTPEHQKKEQADHALVFLFQPFQGKWIQNVAAFLSKGAATGEVLSHLVTECIILLENHGFHVDVVTSDGATWNRGMWKHFGLKDLETSCLHVCSVDEDQEDNDNSSESRRLWFCSDFSHLIKNLRNFLMARAEIMTPDGIFKKKHFRAIIEGDGGTKCLGLKVAHKLTEDHLDPKFYQKMHVNKAFDMFSTSVVAAMEMYTPFNDDLQDCEPTITFISRVSDLIKAMCSRHPNDALSVKSPNVEAIISFLRYLRFWRHTNLSNNYVFMSENTYLGFEVTLKTSIEVMLFLTGKCDYSFLMTARLNQDALEGMFGMIRGCCGSHDKPDPLLFIQIYRLLSFYSLVKPPKGSNVEGLEIFETLLSAKDSLNENKEEWKKVLNNIVERGENDIEEYGVRHAHDYNVFGVNEYALAYFCGFVSRKIDKWTSCEECISSAVKPNENLRREQLINALNRGFLRYPSDNLFNLLFSLEKAILQTVGQEQLNSYTFQHIVQNILSEKITFVGCKEHSKSLTTTIINYYCITRTHILCKKHNSVYDEARKEEKKHRKLAKLVGSSRTEENCTNENEKKAVGKNVRGRKRKTVDPVAKNCPNKKKKPKLKKEEGAKTKQ